MTRRGYDSVNPDAIPQDPEAILLGYVDGNWPTWSVLRRTRKNPIIISIATNKNHTAQMGDCEKDDMKPEDMPSWATMMRSVGGVPIAYCSAGGGPDKPGAWHDVRAQFWAQRVKEPLYAIADYSLGEITEIPQPWVAVGCIGVQYRSDTKQDLDYWIFANYIPGVDPAPINQEVDDDMIWGKDGATIEEQIVDGRTAKCREWWMDYHQNNEPSVQAIEAAVSFWAKNGGDLTQAGIRDGQFGQ